MQDTGYCKQLKMERLMVLEIAFWMYINGSLEELS